MKRLCKVDCFKNYFSSISTVPDTQPILPNLISQTDTKLDQIVIHEQEVVDMLETLNVYKASGPDGISNKMLKSIAMAIAKPLTTLYNRLLEECQLPDTYKYSEIISLF